MFQLQNFFIQLKINFVSIYEENYKFVTHKFFYKLVTSKLVYQIKNV